MIIKLFRRIWPAFLILIDVICGEYGVMQVDNQQRALLSVDSDNLPTHV